MVILPDRPPFVSISGRKVEFSGFPYVMQLCSVFYPRILDFQDVISARVVGGALGHFKANTGAYFVWLDKTQRSCCRKKDLDRHVLPTAS